MKSHWLLAPEIISQERKRKGKRQEELCHFVTEQVNTNKVALKRHDIAPLIWDSDFAANPNPFKTPNGLVPQRGEVVLVTASSGTSNFLGIPNLKNMIYENRMSWANRWGLSSPNLSFSILHQFPSP